MFSKDSVSKLKFIITQFLDKIDEKRAKTPNFIPDDKEWSFVPHINPISAELANRSIDGEEKENIWTSLYKLNEQRKIVLEQKQKQVEEEKMKNDPELTHTPALSNLMPVNFNSCKIRNEGR